MGLQDRGYYDNDSRDPWSSNPDGWKGGGRAKPRTVITILIVINFAFFLLDAFTPVPGELMDQYKLQQAAVRQQHADPNT